MEDSTDAAAGGSNHQDALDEIIELLGGPATEENMTRLGRLARDEVIAWSRAQQHPSYNAWMEEHAIKFAALMRDKFIAPFLN